MRCKVPFSVPVILSAGLLASVFSGCSKEAVPPAEVSEEVTLGSPKIPPFFLCNNSVNGSFAVYKWYSSCVRSYGSLSPNSTNWRTQAPSSLVVGGASPYIRVSQNGSCVDDPSYLRLLQSPTVGQFGPWYLIYPTFGASPTVRKAIKIRVKNIVMPVAAYEFEKGLKYDGTANTWDVSNAIASGNFDIQVITPGYLTLCTNDPREPG